MAKMKQIPLKCFPERPFQPGHVSLVTYGENMEFEVLGRHWHNVVKAAVRSLRSKGKSRVFWGSIGSNYVAFPIVYNYRHVLELYLKGILVTGEEVLVMDGQAGVDAGVFKAHSFARLLPDVERIFDLLRVPYDLGLDGLRTKRDFRRLLADMDKMEIRYPVDTNRKPAMADEFMCFNIFEFAAIMDQVLSTLNNYLGWIGDDVDAQ